MAPTNPKDARHQQPPPYAFILWGDGFDAAVASICATLFRQQGIATKVVSVQGTTALGQHGIQLHPDLSLSRAIQLYAVALAFVIPCSASRLARLENDPRLHHFLQEKATPQTQLIVQHEAMVRQESLRRLPIAQERITICPDWTHAHDRHVEILRRIRSAPRPA